jgi:hypothetical protein
VSFPGRKYQVGSVPAKKIGLLTHKFSRRR